MNEQQARNLALRDRNYVVFHCQGDRWTVLDSVSDHQVEFEGFAIKNSDTGQTFPFDGTLVAALAEAESHNDGALNRPWGVY